MLDDDEGYLFKEKLLDALINKDLINYIRGDEKYFIVPPSAYNTNCVFKPGKNNYFYDIVHEAIVPTCNETPFLANLFCFTIQNLATTGNIYDLYCSFFCCIELQRYKEYEKINIPEKDWQEICNIIKNAISEKLSVLKETEFNDSGETYYEYMSRIEKSIYDLNENDLTNSLLSK